MKWCYSFALGKSRLGRTTDFRLWRNGRIDISRVLFDQRRDPVKLGRRDGRLGQSPHVPNKFSTIYGYYCLRISMLVYPPPRDHKHGSHTDSDRLSQAGMEPLFKFLGVVLGLPYRLLERFFTGRSTSSGSGGRDRFQ